MVVVDGDDGVSDLDGCGGGLAGAADPCGTIQAGVDAAQPGDSVVVELASVAYAESVTIQTDDIELLGPNADVPGPERELPISTANEAVLDVPDVPGGVGILIDADGVTVSGLAVRDAASAAGVEIVGDDALITNLLVSDVNPGVRIAGDGAAIVDNAIYGSATNQGNAGGIRIGPDDPGAIAGLRVSGNLVDGMRDFGIALGLVTDLTIKDNVVFGRGRTLENFWIAFSNNVTMARNVSFGQGNGMDLFAVHDATISDNLVADGFNGIIMGGMTDPGSPVTTGLRIEANDIFGNGNGNSDPSGGIVFNEGALGDPAVVIGNSIVGNVFSDSGAGVVDNGAGAPVLAAHNWWGCNEGPAHENCDGVVGDVVSAPWLRLSLRSEPATLSSQGRFQLTASIRGDSNGQELPASQPVSSVPVTIEKISGAGTLINPPETLVDGLGPFALDAPTTGATEVRALVDAATASLLLRVGQPGTDSPGPTGNAPKPVAGLRRTAIRASLRADLRALATKAKRLDLARLRRTGRFKTPALHTLGAGRLTLVLKVKAVHGATNRPTIVIARGTLVAKRAGGRALTLRLTKPGQRILQDRRRVPATALLSFRAPTGKPVSQLARLRLGS